jgi:hypothetical protein
VPAPKSRTRRMSMATFMVLFLPGNQGGHAAALASRRLGFDVFEAE